jgi:hypothetical protein
MKTPPRTVKVSGPAAVKISKLTVASEFNIRVKIDPGTLIKYREIVRACHVSKWPFQTPCDVCKVDGQKILIDGFMRLEAMRLEGRAYILATQFEGTRLDALKAALRSNTQHGLHRTEDDNRRCVMMALQDTELRSLPDDKLIEICKVSADCLESVRSGYTKPPAVQDKPPEVKTHVEHLELTEEQFESAFKSLKRMEGWADTKERSAAVRRFVTKCRKTVASFEKYTTVGAEPKKTLFEVDADIPEHLQTDEFMSAWNSWWKHRQQRKLSVSDTTKKRQLNLLKFGDAEQAAAIVSKAEENKWQGIPDTVWIPSRMYSLWCDRMPPHASAELTTKIRAALPTLNTNGAKTVSPVKVNRGTWGARGSSEFEEMSVEEQRKAMLADR